MYKFELPGRRPRERAKMDVLKEDMRGVGVIEEDEEEANDFTVATPEGRAGRKRNCIS